MNYSLLRSRTFWSAVALFVVTAGNAVMPLVPEAYSAFVGAILLALTGYFHLDTAQKFGAVN